MHSLDIEPQLKPLSRFDLNMLAETQTLDDFGNDGMTISMRRRLTATETQTWSEMQELPDESMYSNKSVLGSFYGCVLLVAMLFVSYELIFSITVD